MVYSGTIATINGTDQSETPNGTGNNDGIYAQWVALDLVKEIQPQEWMSEIDNRSNEEVAVIEDDDPTGENDPAYQAFLLQREGHNDR
jgi:hypothetical protein